MSGTMSLAYGLSIGLAEAKRVAAAAEAEASRHGWTVVIAITDTGGHLLYLQRADGTQIGSVVVAQEKARTAIAFKRPSKVFHDAVAGGAQAILGLTGVLPLAGGVPLVKDGRIVGAIGVSGVQSHEDHQIAEVGAAALAAGSEAS